MAGKTRIHINSLQSTARNQKSFITVLFQYGVVLLCCLAYSFQVAAQKKTDTAGKVPIEIMPGVGLLQSTMTDSGELTKLLGNVILKQGETLMYCDSAYIYMAKNNFEAFSNVRIVQAGSQGQSDYMKYIGNDKMAYMKNNVMLTDGKSNLWSEEVAYDVANKIGTYSQGGTLQDSATTVSSNAGIYNMKSKEARFTDDVIVTDPQYNITSADMGYNTETKVTTFFSPSVVTSEKSVLHTSCGTYDGRNEIANFNCRSSIMDDAQYIVADSIYHNKKTGIGVAVGQVVAIDTTQHTTLYSGRTDYNGKKRTMLAYIKPVMKQMNNGDKDSLFIRADTFFSAPIPMPGDSLKTAKVIKTVKTTGKGRNKKQVITETPVEDTTSADSTRPRYFIGYHHVLIFSDSMQGRCDSVLYSQQDSTMRMMYDPIVWSRKSQITGDTILLYMDSGKAREIYVPNNALVVSQSGPDQAKLYDQVQGKTLRGFFKNNTITDMVVKPEAETIYYAKEDDGSYIGVNEASSERMKVFFKDEELNHIVFEQGVKHKMTPMNKADFNIMKLKRFKWLDDKRPKKLSELFE